METDEKGYDPSKDVLIKAIGTALDGALVVELRSWDGGPSKVAVTRVYKRKAGPKPGRLGRLTGEEAAALAPLLVQAAKALGASGVKG